MKKLIILMAFAAIIFNGNLPAQDSVRISPFHISFITPLGTNGLQSWNTVNRISFNLFAGYSAGLNGIEVAGFANALKGDMNGIQLAGFCNNTFGEANGVEIAGYWNYNQHNVKGLQLAGFANVALDTVDGVQIAGYTNVTVGDAKGVQASGFSNVTTGTQTGVQASGFFNYAHRLKGVQVSVVNVADTVEKGIPIGFLSFVKHGYKVIQLGGNETLYGEVSFKTGVRQFYNILSIGATSIHGDLKWGFGYGLGTLIPMGRHFDIGIEAVSYQIMENEWYSPHMNLLNRANLSFCWNLTRNIGIYVGASWNVLVAGNEIDTEYQHHYRSDVSMYPGFNAGLRIGL